MGPPERLPHGRPRNPLQSEIPVLHPRGRTRRLRQNVPNHRRTPRGRVVVLPRSHRRVQAEPQTSAVTPFGLGITKRVDVSDLDDHRKEPAEVVARRAVNDRRLMATPKLRAINMELCADRERWMNGEPTKSSVLVYHLRLKLAFAEHLEEERLSANGEQRG
ncbi:hypothetical protein PG997_008730 [Apiospora hydei]|uniref:Uncharacterized protein n=1 Tax=Apiospora hydei TaxID=1337664 RepID=A0ABR1WBP5_9PEZI